MEVSVWVGPVNGRGYRATSEALSVSAEGATEREALERIGKVLEERVADGYRLLTVNVPAGTHPAERFFGTLKDDDPLVDNWKSAMAEYRRRIDEDENAL